MEIIIFACGMGGATLVATIYQIVLSGNPVWLFLLLLNIVWFVLLLVGLDQYKT